MSRCGSWGLVILMPSKPKKQYLCALMYIMTEWGRIVASGATILPFFPFVNFLFHFSSQNTQWMKDKSVLVWSKSTCVRGCWVSQGVGSLVMEVGRPERPRGVWGLINLFTFRSLGKIKRECLQKSFHFVLVNGGNDFRVVHVPPLF
jgi:hypothetical protein